MRILSVSPLRDFRGKKEIISHGKHGKEHGKCESFPCLLSVTPVARKKLFASENTERNTEIYMLRLIFLLLFLLTISLPGFAQEDENVYRYAAGLAKAFQHAANRVIPATVKVIAHLRSAEELRAMQAQTPAIPYSRDSRRPGDETGTAMIIDPRGILLTNNHVVAKGKEIEVELPDGRKFFVKKYRHDPATDLAVMWLDVEPDEELPFVEFGDSDQTELCEWVLAVGNPFELDSTVSVGIISAKGRSLGAIQRTEFFQTDASINPGNSGGPLINLRGEVIGINTAIISKSGGNQGIGFALPSNNAQWVAKQLYAKGKVDRAWLGAITYPATPWEAKRLKIKPRIGVIVDYTVQKSPAERAKLRKDDVILSFDGQQTDAVYQLQRFVERADVTKKHRMEIIRNGERLEIPLDVEAMPEAAPATLIGGKMESYLDGQLGIQIVQAPEALLSRLGIKGQQGVTAISIVPDSRAERAGLKLGMLITKINGTPVPTREAYIAARSNTSLSDGITLDVVHPGGATGQVVVKLGE